MNFFVLKATPFRHNAVYQHLGRARIVLLLLLLSLPRPVLADSKSPLYVALFGAMGAEGRQSIFTGQVTVPTNGILTNSDGDERFLARLSRLYGMIWVPALKNSEVSIRVEGKEIEVTTDEIGRFKAVLENDGLTPGSHNITIAIPGVSDVFSFPSGLTIFPETPGDLDPQGVAFIDVDQTFLLPSEMAVVASVLFPKRSSREDIIVPGAPEFLKWLHQQRYRIFFVSGRPSGFHAAVTEILWQADIPKPLGLFTRPIQGLPVTAGPYKMALIQENLEFLPPGFPVFLLGDTGQKDRSTFKNIIELNRQLDTQREFFAALRDVKADPGKKSAPINPDPRVITVFEKYKDLLTHCQTRGLDSLRVHSIGSGSSLTQKRTSSLDKHISSFRLF